MLSVFQTRTIQWEREASEFNDTQMTSIATVMLSAPVFWTELEIGKARTHLIEHEDHRILIVVDCLSPVDDIQLQILSVQYF